MEKNVEYYPLTHPQKAVWFTEKLHPGTSIGNVAGTLRIKAKVDLQILEKAINVFIEKNDSMRLHITEFEGEPKQYISDYVYCKLDIIDFSERDLNELYKWDALQTKTTFELIDSDLFYFALIKISDSDSGFYIKCHHLISDAWSMSLLGNQIMSCYSDIKKGCAISEYNNPSYLDYIISEEEYINSDRMGRDKEYWNKIFRSFPGKTLLKTGNSDNISIKARRKTMLTPRKLTTKIYQYCSENKTSVFSLFTAALSMYINRVTAKEDIILGTTTLNRLNLKEKETVGMFNNIIPMRIDVRDEMDFKALIDCVSKEGLKLLRHQKYPYELILKDVRKEHKISENIFNIVLIYQNSKFYKDNHIQNYTTRWHFNGYQVDSLHISINDRENEGHLIIDYDYQTDLFHAKEIDFIHQNIINILWHALDNPAKKISKLEMLSEKEKHKILNEFNKTKIIYPVGLNQVFEESGKKIPVKAKCYILDKNLNLLPIGIAGELYISGANLTLRKLKALGLSEKMAIPNPYSSEDILYSLGCRARWFPDGDIMYLGSIDTRKPLGNSEEGTEKEEIKVDIISTFTAEPVESYIKWWGEKFGYNLKINFAGYNQVFQELLNPNSMLSENIKGINVVMVRFEDFIRYDNGTDEAKLLILERTYEELKEAVGRFENRVPMVIAIFPVSTHLGLSDILRKKIAKINADFTETLLKHKNFFVLDFNELQVLYGIQDVFDLLKDKEGHMPFTEEYYAAMGTEVARKICAIKRQNFKVIVLDCDNTLWKGICGELGTLGVQVTDSYRQLQQFMLQKYKEGMLLAVCSKNNEKDVFEVFNNNPGMVLNKNHIVNWKINWKEKSDNIKHIAGELNLGLDSFIFIDDDLLECSKMVEQCPEVLTLQLPQEDEYILAFLKHVWAFDRVKVTNEDVLRNSMYEAEQKRKEFRNKNVSLESFMKSLQLKVSMRVIVEDEIERAAQLTQRTNQFNLSSIRRDEDEIAQLLKDKESVCFVVEASDKFGDYGIIGLVIFKDNGNKLFLDTFLMSCRIFGRNVEDVLLTGIGRYARELGRHNIEAIFIQTEKNKPVHDFIKRMKWMLVEETEKLQRYSLNIEDIPGNIEHIEFYYNEMYDRNDENLLLTDSALFEHRDNESLKLNNNRVVAKYDINFYDTEVIKNVKYKEYIEPLNHLTGRKLLHINSNSGASNDVYGIVENETQEKLVFIWQSLLKADRIGIDDDFFKLGGDSLSAVILVSRINKEFGIELTLRDVFSFSTIRKLAEKITRSNKSEYERIVPVYGKTYYELSSAQKRMFILNRIEKDSTRYNECHIILIEGKLDRYKLEAAFKEFINRHEAMRTGFEMLDDEPVQRVYNDIDFSISYSKVKTKDIVKLTNEFVMPFDLSKPPLIRVSLLETGKERYVLLLDIHHIIVDGTSFGILIQEIQALYEGSELDLPEIQYKDFANWQNALLKSQKIKEQEEYWKEQFCGEIPVLNLPADHVRPAVQSFNGRKKYFTLCKSKVNKLKLICNESETTLFMLIFAAFNVLLYRYTGQEDIIIGTPVSGRRHEETKNIVGMFVNTLPIRTFPKNNCKFLSYLSEVKEKVLMGLENQDYQYEALVDKLNVQRDLNRNPLFDIAFSLQNTEIPDIKLNELTMSHCRIDNQKSKFDISLLAVEKGEVLEFELEYSTDLFEDDTIVSMQEHYLNVLDEVSNNPQVIISDIDIMSDEEKRKIIYEFNDTQADYPKDKTIHQLFEEQTERTPDNVAVVFEDKQLSYSDLNAKANQLARVLRNQGVKPETIVAIMVERSLEMIIGILAILKAGGAYLPIDPEYPEERIKYMIRNSDIHLLLSTGTLKGKIAFDKIIYLDESRENLEEDTNLTNVSKPDDLLYVIYTSGSTGKPKGVMLEHKNIINLVYFQHSKTGVYFNDNVMQFASMSFDVCSQEIFSTLLAGGTLFILSSENKNNITSMCNFIRLKKIRIIYLPTAFFKLLISKIEYLKLIPENVRHIIVAGEKLVLNKHIREFMKNNTISLHNHYGPAETHVVTTYTLNGPTNISDIPYIGKPISNTKIFILDNAYNIQPIGVYGEIYISGENVGRGYINNSNLTADRFQTIQMCNKSLRCYKTGDIGKWTRDGNIEYLGRKDTQVKIRGYRVELEEVEKCLLKYSSVRECVVITKSSSNDSMDLIAYLTSDELIQEDALKDHLKNYLPIYMIPKYFIQLDRIPLTNNGKIDKKKLLTIPVLNNKKQKIEYPSSEKEKALLDIWKSVLNVKNLDINDHFFENGGDSLFIIKVLLEAEKRGYHLSVKEMFLNPSIKELCMNKTGDGKHDQ